MAAPVRTIPVDMTRGSPWTANPRRRRPRALPGALLLAACLAAPTPASAQVLNFTAYGANEGLPQLQVFALLQDTRGFIWIGTYGGLSRYDGREFRTVTTRDGLAANHVVDLVEGPGGEIIAGTIGGGVCFVDPGRLSCLGAVEALAGDAVTDLHLDPDGVLWVATESGVSEVRDRTVVRTYTTADGLPSPRVTGVTRAHDGGLRVTTQAGTAELKDGAFVLHDPSSVGGGPAERLHVARDGVYIFGPRGLARHENGVMTPVSVPGAAEVVVTDAFNDASGGVWFATRSGALHVQGATTTSITTENGLLSNEVNRVLVDREGSIWFGTENGLSKLVPGPFSLWTVREGLPPGLVRAVAEDAGGRVWVGTREGVAVLEGDRFRRVPLPATVPDQRVYALAPTSRGGMYVGTRGGLVVLGEGNARVFGPADGLPASFVTGLLPDGDAVWVATSAGVVRLERGRIVTAGLPELEGAFVTTTARDGAGRAWFGLRSGGVRIWDGETLARLGPNEGLTDQVVWSLAPDQGQGMWVGSNGDGAFHVFGDSIARVTTRDGLVDDFVWQVLQDSRGDVWFFTSHGLDRLDADGMTHFGRGDGLVDPEGSATAILEDSSGHLWFGSGSGVYRFDPAGALPGLAPAVYVEEILAGGTSYPASNARIPARTAAVTLRFAAPSFRNEGDIRFRYRFPEEDPTWSEPVREHVVRIAGLRPGRHLVEVTAVGPGGLESPEPARASFSVLPALWQTWWFRGLVGALVLAAAGALPSLRARRLERERVRLEGLVHERTRALEDRTERLRIEMEERVAAQGALREREEQLHQAQKMEALGRLAGGVAHDFNNLLTVVIGHADMAAEDLGPGHPLHEDILEVGGAARRGAALVSQLLAFGRRQIVTERLLDLRDAVGSALDLTSRMARTPVQTDLKVSPDPAWSRISPSQVEQIVVNLVMNALTAMPEGGTLTVSVGPRTLDADATELGPDNVPPGAYAVLCVADTGKGMDQETLARAFEPFFTTKDFGDGSGLGLPTVYGMVHQNNGFVQVRSHPGRGTEVFVYLPMEEAAAPEARA